MELLTYQNKKKECEDNLNSLMVQNGMACQAKVVVSVTKSIELSVGLDKLGRLNKLKEL